jgi:hypothetical protein
MKVASSGVVLGAPSRSPRREIFMLGASGSTGSSGSENLKTRKLQKNWRVLNSGFRWGVWLPKDGKTWLFLGIIDPVSIFYRIPIEVIFN